MRYIRHMAGSATAGNLVRRARHVAGLSQSELAARAGTTQSVVSVYESGRRQPSLPMLVSLIEAAGARLDISLAPITEHPASLADRVHENADVIHDAAAAAGMRILGIFGSVARGEDRPDSDVDLLIDVPDGVGLFALGRLEARLRDLLDAEIDLVPAAGLKPRVRAAIDAELRPL